MNKRIIFPPDVRFKFKSFINSRTGLYFKDYDLKNLDGIIAERMKSCGLDTVSSYYALLSSSEKTEEELRELLNRLTVNHTYFFRNEPQFKALKDKILPELIGRKLSPLRGGEAPPSSLRGGHQADEAISKNEITSPATFGGEARNDVIRPTIRIWSAGCSTGEEPYTIAMILEDIIPDIENWDIQILATDASMEALDRARKGVYSVNSMRLVDHAHKSRYFSFVDRAGNDAKYAIRDEIKRRVNFSFFNLMDEDYPKQFDIIFCRNVTIYFELENTVRVIKNMAESLNDDGYLFIGYSETLQFVSDEFKMVNMDDAIFYLKTKPVGAPKKFVPPRPEPIEFKMDAIFEKISKAEFEADSRERTKKKCSPEFEGKIVRAMKAIHSKNYEEALSLTEEARVIDKEEPEAYYVAAEAYTNQGKFKDAKDNLYAALKKDTMYAPAHYLFGSLYSEEGNLDLAEESYRKALYLEKEFSLAHFSLANIYRERGSYDAALREYRNTLDVLSKLKPYDILAYGGGFNAATLASVCRENIERLKVAGL